MKSYFSVSPSGKRTGVVGYDYGEDWVTVCFSSGAEYTYTTQSCGAAMLAEIKRLADGQHGLNSYLNHFKPGFAHKKR